VSPSLPKDPLVWAGFAHGVAAFAYPTFLVPAIVTACVIFACSRDRRRSFARFVGGGLLLAVVASPVIVAAGVSHLRDVYGYSSVTMGDASIYRRALFPVARAIVTDDPELIFAAAVMSVVSLQRSRVASLAALTLPLLPLLLFGPSIATSGFIASSRFVIAFALLAPFVTPRSARNRSTTRTLMLAVWAPAILAGILTAWSSINQTVAASLGFVPAAIVTAIFLALRSQEALSWISGGARSSFAVLLSTFTFPVILLHCEWLADAVYEEEQLSELTAQITEGPYKGSCHRFSKARLRCYSR
jgi:hypothetical protein